MRLEEFYKSIHDTMKMLTKDFDKYQVFRIVLAEKGIDEFGYGFKKHDMERMAKGIIIAKTIELGYYSSPVAIKSIADDVRYYLAPIYDVLTPEWLDEIHKEVLDTLWSIARQKELSLK